MPRNYSHYLLFQIARFGALTIPQMEKVCEGTCKRSSIYRALIPLIERSLVQLCGGNSYGTRTYYITRKGRDMIFGSPKPMASSVREIDMKHTIACTDVLLNLAKRENVFGIATPFETSPRDCYWFSFRRIPDGIVRIKKEDQLVELAVEMECTKRSHARMQKMLEIYRLTIGHGSQCGGLLIVAGDSEIRRRYEKALAKMPDEFRSLVSLVEGTSLAGLDEKAFGQQTRAIAELVDLIRNTSLDDIRYTQTKLEFYRLCEPFTGYTPQYTRHPKRTRVANAPELSQISPIEGPLPKSRIIL